MKPNWPDHKCSMTISHNMHKDYYQSVKDYISEREVEFENEESKQRAIDNNEIWEICWYPHTPIGSYSVAAPTFEEALNFANSSD